MSIAHLILLFFILLLVFGPSRLEGLGLSLGRAIRGFKKGLEEGSEEENKKNKQGKKESDEKDSGSNKS
jgi:sec-independent protein translocase protein TatA